MIKNKEFKIHNDLLLSKEEVWSFQKLINDFGPRLTGNAAHEKYVDFLRDELESYGLAVLEDKHRFNRWEAKQWKLIVENEKAVEEEIPVTFYYPYSGVTSKRGVTGELIYCGKGEGNFKYAKGKIAIVDVVIPSVPRSLLFKKRSSYPSGAKLPFLIDNPVVGSVLKGANLRKAASEGVLGVICIWRKISSENASQQYLPFTEAYKGCPSLWVDFNTGERLKELASINARATIILEASIENNAESSTIYTVLPGSNTEETIIVNTHTDGPNACEENGGIALLALARYFSKIPVSERNRTIVFVFVTGHFQIPQFGVDNHQATSRWLYKHPELWTGNGTNKKAVAGVTIEHLGCTGWKDDKKHLSYKKVSPVDFELVYTGNKAMNEIYMRALGGRTKINTITLRQRNNIYFGEGQPLFQANIPTVSLVPAPDYLCKVSSNGDIDKLDADLMYEQIQTFLKVIIEIDSTSCEILGKPQRQSYGVL